jgi:uncharacterized DUF497 family protein
MRYEWNEAKRRANVAKHGVDFVDADRFEWPTAVVRVDDREDYGELREIALGFIGVRLHLIAYTPLDEDTARIITLRKATRRETRDYEKARKRAGL